MSDFAAVLVGAAAGIPTAAFLARATLILLLGFTATLLLRRGPARLHHRIWVLVFAGLLTIPVLSATLPGWAVLPSTEALRPTSPGAPLGTAGVGERPGTVEEGPLDPAGPVTSAREASAPAAHTEGTAGRGTEAAASGGPAPDIAAPPVGRGTSPGALAVPLVGRLLTGAWLAGTALVLLWACVGIVRLARVRREARRVGDGRVLSELAELVQQTGVSGREVLLLLGDGARVPGTWGFLRPVILLPTAVADGPAAQRRTVLLHELIHIRRGDWLLRLAVLVACAMLWFHPLVWVARRSFLDAEEGAVDDEVVGLGLSPTEYATHLLEIVRRLGSAQMGVPLQASVPLVPRASSLERRIRNLVAGSPRIGASVRTRIGVSLAVGLGVVAVAALEGAPPGEPHSQQAAERLGAPERADMPESTDTLRPPEATGETDPAEASVGAGELAVSSAGDAEGSGKGPVQLRLVRVLDGTELPGGRPFGRITDAAVLADGRLAILEGTAGGRILILGETGGLLGASPLGSLGEGPTTIDALIPYGEDGLALADGRRGRLLLHRVADDGSLETVRQLESPVGFEDACWMAGRFYLVDRAGAGEPGESSTLRSVVRVLSEEGSAVGSLGTLPQGVEGMAQVPYRQARVACLPEASLLVLQSRFFSEITGWSPEGELQWRSNVPGFRPLEITGELDRVTYALPEGQQEWHRLEALLAVGPEHFVVQTDLRMRRSTDPQGPSPNAPIETSTLPLEAVTGTFLDTLWTDLPHLVAASRIRALGLRHASSSERATLFLYEVVVQ